MKLDSSLATILQDMEHFQDKQMMALISATPFGTFTQSRTYDNSSNTMDNNSSTMEHYEIDMSKLLPGSKLGRLTSQGYKVYDSNGNL